MLTIPDTVKSLYKGDGVWKSIYITGDDGILIRNHDIVRESFKFTESCCSDNVFRFGGCERSMVEFETVGVGNILGKTIQVYIDIALTSLSAAQISAIEADPGDGEVAATLDAAYQTVTVYRITLGQFRVVKCVRDHRQQTHRQITAYSPRYWRLSPIGEAKLDWYAGGSVYNVSPAMFMLENVGYWAPGFMTEMGYTKAQFIAWSATAWTSSSFNDQSVISTLDGREYTVVRSGTYRTLVFNAFRQGLFGIHIGDIDAKGLDDFYKLWLSGVDWATTSPNTGIEDIRSPEAYVKYGLFPACCALTKTDITSSLAHPVSCQRAVLTGDAPVFYTSGAAWDRGPRRLLSADSPYEWTLSLLESITVQIYDEGSELVSSFSTALDTDMPVIYKWSASSADLLPTTTLTVPISDEVTWNDGDNDYEFHRWSIDAEAVIKGWMEINGCMLTPGRSAPRVVQLSQASPLTLIPGDFESFWWDEQVTDPVGTVTYTFGKDHELLGVCAMGGGGGSVYDLGGNGMLDLVPEARSGDIPDMISARMAAGVSLLGSCSPAEVSMPAWPWLEPGDALQYETADEEQVDTFIMQRTMSGVQLLMDVIQAPGGDVEDDE